MWLLVSTSSCCWCRSHAEARARRKQRCFLRSPPPPLGLRGCEAGCSSAQLLLTWRSNCSCGWGRSCRSRDAGCCCCWSRAAGRRGGSCQLDACSCLEGIDAQPCCCKRFSEGGCGCGTLCKTENFCMATRSRTQWLFCTSRWYSSVISAAITGTWGSGCHMARGEWLTPNMYHAADALGSAVSTVSNTLGGSKGCKAAHQWEGSTVTALASQQLQAYDGANTMEHCWRDSWPKQQAGWGAGNHPALHGAGH